MHADDEDSLPVLRHKAAGVNGVPRDTIAELVRERAADDLEGPAAVVGSEILYVLEYECFRLLLLDDPLEIEKERALRAALEAVLAAERVLRRYAGDAERLAREASDQYVVVRNNATGDLCNVTVHFMIAE